MTEREAPAITALVRETAHRLRGSPAHFDPRLDRIGKAPLALLGEASQGTHELYGIRAKSKKRLIREKGCLGVAIEADWPDAYRINRYVRGRSADGDAAEALSGFLRFPQWMWRFYRPDTERVSHYFLATLPRQFDTVLHYDHSRAVEPLERTPVWEKGEAELPETYPFEV